MANNKSAIKRIKLNKRNRLRNKYYKTSVKSLIKLFFVTIETYKFSQNDNDKKKVQEILNLVYSLLDKGIKKNVFHKNMAARKKAKLVAYLKSS